VGFKEWSNRQTHPAVLIVLIPLAGFFVAAGVVALLVASPLAWAFAGMLGAAVGLVVGISAAAKDVDDEPPR
jgi:positive regulator of sigma E activity